MFFFNDNINNLFHIVAVEGYTANQTKESTNASAVNKQHASNIKYLFLNKSPRPLKGFHGGCMSLKPLM